MWAEYIPLALLFFAIIVKFFIHLHTLISKCKLENIKMEPGLVWLNLIPIFNLGWIFYTTIKIRDTLEAEFKSRNIKSDDPRFAYSIGFAHCVTLACSIIPFIGFFTLIASFILWIIYWVKTYKYSIQLNQ